MGSKKTKRDIKKLKRENRRLKKEKESIIKHKDLAERNRMLKNNDSETRNIERGVRKKENNLRYKNNVSKELKRRSNERENKRVKNIDKNKKLNYLRSKGIDTTNNKGIKLDDKEIDDLYKDTMNNDKPDFFKDLRKQDDLGNEDNIRDTGMKVNSYDIDNNTDLEELEKKEKKNKNKLRRLKVKKNIQKTSERIRKTILWLVGIVGGLWATLIIIISVLIILFGSTVLIMLAFDEIKDDLKKAGALGDEEVVKLTDAEKGDLTGMLGSYVPGKGVGINTKTGGIEDAKKSGAKSDSGATLLEGDSNPEKTWNFFIKKGYSKEATSAIMGNLQQESTENFDTSISDGTGAVGIAQWMDVRLENLKKKAEEEGKPFTDLGVQIDYIDWEIRGGDPQAYQGLKASHKGDIENFIKSTDERYSAEQFDIYFERSYGSERQIRIENATRWMQKYGGKK